MVGNLGERGAEVGNKNSLNEELLDMVQVKVYRGLAVRFFIAHHGNLYSTTSLME